MKNNIIFIVLPPHVDHLKISIQESIQVRDFTSIEFTTPFKSSVLISSPLYNDNVHLPNVALLAELSSSGPISTPA